MRTPATFGRFLLAACYAIGLVQLAALGVLVARALAGMMNGTRPVSKDPLPEWLLVGDLALSVVLVLVAYVMYRRGDLDEYTVRRR